MRLPWHVGDRPKITMYFTNDVGAMVDPDMITAKIKDPSGGIKLLTYPSIDSAITKDATGIYHFHVDLAQSGNYFYYVAATGTKAVAGNGTIFAVPSGF